MLSFAACNSGGIKIEGKFSDNTNDEKQVYLQTIEDMKYMQNIKVLDSTIVKNGKFTLKSDIKNTPTIGFVSVGKMDDLIKNQHENPVIASIVIEEGTTQINFEKSTYTLDGTPHNKELNKVVLVMNKGNKLNEEMMNLQLPDSGAVDENGNDIMTRMQNLGKEMQTETYNFLKTNMNNKVGEFIFMTSSNLLTTAQMKELLTLADSTFLSIPQVAEFKAMLDNQADSMDEISVTDLSGNTVKLSDYVGKGKYVLVDFWATWCGPCMQEVPNLKKAYAAYKNKGLEIVGVSLDEDLNAWKSVVKDKGMDWIQLHDSNKAAGTYYQVSSIPFTMLFDKEGNIVEMNLRGPKLEQKLKELLK